MTSLRLGNLDTKFLPSYHRMVFDEQQAFDEMSASLRRKLRLISEHSQGKRIQTGTLTGAFTTFGGGAASAAATAASSRRADGSQKSSPRVKVPVEGLDLDTITAVALIEEAELRSRPRSACYHSSKCRPTRAGSGGSPRTPQRPRTAPANCVKTERWRETGAIRWPAPATEPPMQLTADSERMPFRLLLPHAPETLWHEALWARSLRSATVRLEDQMFADFGPYGLRELHQDARKVAERGGRPASRQFGGMTASARSARAKPSMKDWVERPVSTGRLAQDHKYGGKRYTFSKSPRNISQQTPSDLAPVTGFET
mmetsp:Transcript_10484/g.18948  ORF Transcript_10484/g.18948 Transcript_10484/m.18948 type:complete len:314 (-) Transcript_10484:169-1110(-)